MQENNTDTTAQDDELRALFSRFDPVLPPDTRFMAQLQQRLDTIELLQNKMAAMRRRNRLAVACAAFAGFAAGILSCMLMPLLTALLENLRTEYLFLPDIPHEASVLLWLLPAGAALLTSLRVYDMTSRAGY
ncbi:MAG: hypothetical protein K2J92_06325 [Muribaculaceae bacterium]|nr:hypothetical protein [Muribaculaceae bacterium]MDE7189056.1 hypothetical protein [Muribaculaceae bacterium]